MIKNKEYYTLKEHFENLVKNKYFRKTIAVKQECVDKRSKDNKITNKIFYKIVNYEPSITLIVGNMVFESINPLSFLNTNSEYILNLPVLKIRIEYSNIRTDERKSYTGTSTILDIPNEIISFDSDKLTYSRDSYFIACFNGRILIYVQDLPKKYIESELYKKNLLNKDILVCLKTYGNTVYRGSTYNKALEYYKNKEVLEKTISDAVGFDVYIRKPNEEYADNNCEDLRKPFFIIETKQSKNLCQK